MSSAARQAVRRLFAATGSGDLTELCTRSGIQLMVLFGSARHPDGDPSDVDVAVRFDRDASHDVLGLLDGLYDLTGYEGYDVLDLGRAGPLPRERAMVGARVLYEHRPGMFANEQIAAIMERLETDEMRRVELALMTR